MSEPSSGADLALARRAAAGESDAIAAIDRLLVAALERAARRVGGSDRHRDDVLQQIRAQLFAPNAEGRRGIEGFGGHGSLEGWLRITAGRALLRAVKKGHHERPLTDALLEALASGDPEMDHLAQEYGRALAEAFAEAAAALTPRQRTLLRHQYVDGLASEDIGPIYGVHRATVSRWIADARETLERGTREVLRRRLRVSTRELDSILRLAQQRLEVSMRVLLASRED